MKASPAARKLAKELQIDLEDMEFEDPNKVIQTEDILMAKERLQRGGRQKSAFKDVEALGSILLNKESKPLFDENYVEDESAFHDMLDKVEQQSRNTDDADPFAVFEQAQPSAPEPAADPAPVLPDDEDADLDSIIASYSENMAEEEHTAASSGSPRFTPSRTREEDPRPEEDVFSALARSLEDAPAQDEPPKKNLFPAFNSAPAQDGPESRNPRPSTGSLGFYSGFDGKLADAPAYFDVFDAIEQADAKPRENPAAPPAPVSGVPVTAPVSPESAFAARFRERTPMAGLVLTSIRVPDISVVNLSSQLGLTSSKGVIRTIMKAVSQALDFVRVDYYDDMVVIDAGDNFTSFIARNVRDLSVESMELERIPRSALNEADITVWDLSLTGLESFSCTNVAGMNIYVYHMAGAIRLDLENREEIMDAIGSIKFMNKLKSVLENPLRYI